MLQHSVETTGNQTQEVRQAPAGVAKVLNQTGTKGRFLPVPTHTQLQSWHMPRCMRIE
jgi:hypothetical protein